MTTQDIMTHPLIRETVFAHAQAAFPREACGLLVRRGDRARVVLAENLASPRDAETRYVLDPLEIVQARRSGEHLVAIFHSHCGRGSYFSDEDVAGALIHGSDGGGDPRPAYPGVDHVVLNAQPEGVRGYAIYRFDPSRAGFMRTHQHGDVGTRRRAA